ncbi:transposase family protein [Streptomyces sp. NPDC055752]
MRRPAAGRKDLDKFISGEDKQNAVKSMVVTDAEGRLLFRSPAEPASCADITHAQQLGLVKLPAGGPFVEVLADAGYQGLGAQTGGRVITPPHRKSSRRTPRTGTKKCTHASAKAHSSRRIRVEHGHRARDELASPRTPSWPPRVHDGHHPSRRRTALTPADRHHAQRSLLRAWPQVFSGDVESVSGSGSQSRWCDGALRRKPGGRRGAFGGGNSLGTGGSGALCGPRRFVARPRPGTEGDSRRRRLLERCAGAGVLLVP